MVPTLGPPRALRIGELAARAGVSTQAVRFYERRRLIPAAARTAAGYRLFPPSTVGHIRLIRDAQAAGFTLEQVAFGLLLGDRRAGCDTALDLWREKMAELDRQIAELERKKHALDSLRRRCPEGGLTSAPCRVFRPAEETSTAVSRSGR